MDKATKGEWFALVNEFCTNATIRGLLKHAKEVNADKRALRTGSREQLLRFLRAANERGSVTDEQLRTLIRTSEESGRQHVVLYRVKDVELADELNNHESVELKLLGEQGAKARGLPVFLARPQGVQLSDFRSESVAGSNYSSWTLKLYAGEERRRFLYEKAQGKNRIVRHYERVYERGVTVCKWHSYGLLECRFRIYQGMNQSSLSDDLKDLHEILAPLIPPDQFAGLGLNLGPAMTKLVAERRVNKEDYFIGSAWFQASDGVLVKFETRTVEDNLETSEQSRRALVNFDLCRRLVLTFRERPQRPGFEESLRLEVASFLANEFRVGAQATSEAVAHVIRRLFELSPAA